MSKVKQALGRARYTMEFKVEAIRLAKGAQGLAGTARVLDVPVQTLHGWVTQHDQGKLQGAGDKPSVPSKWSWPACVLSVRGSRWNAIF
jgi:transposase